MMVTTHAAVGVTIAAGVAAIAPDHAAAAAVGGLVGGAVPDLDLFVGVHRRTLHFPVLGWIPVGPAVLVAGLLPGPWSIGIATAVLAAAVHASSDVLGAGEELRPWERTTDEAVYAHVPRPGRWLTARYLVRYDGAPEDLLLTVVFALPGIVVFPGVVRWLCVGMVVAATLYALVRKRVPEYVRLIRTERE